MALFENWYMSTNWKQYHFSIFYRQHPIISVPVLKKLSFTKVIEKEVELFDQSLYVHT